MTSTQDVVRMLLQAAEHRLRLVEARVGARRRLGGVPREDMADLGALQVAVSGLRVAQALYATLLDEPQSAADVPPTTAEVPP